MLQILIGIAALFGCIGIIFAAAGAHAKPGSGLDSAGHMLLFHAPAVIATCAAIVSGLVIVRSELARRSCCSWVWRCSRAIWPLRAYTGHRLFRWRPSPAAWSMIGGWALLALAAFLALRS